MFLLIRAGILCFLCITSYYTYAITTLIQKKEVQQFIRHMEQKHGFAAKDLQALFQEVTLQAPIIASITKPYEKKTWDEYKQLFLTPERIAEGITFWRKHQKALAKAEQLYGVPPNIIIAIIGVETFYGRHQGTYRVIDALSTLAFDYPPRSAFFTKELEEFLLLCREHGVHPREYVGSYAGAMGKPQFMPSSYRNYAADFIGNPKKDLMHDDDAVIASVANYFQKHGWRNNQGVAQPAKIIGNGYKHIDTNHKTAGYSLQELSQRGVLPLTASMHHPDKAGLIALATHQGPEFWLAYPNFYVITRYNTSPQYALAVYLLSLQLKTQWATSAKNLAYAFA